MSVTASDSGRWADTWIDAVAFIGGLGMAWYFSWKTTDLVWSLWLSSLVLGYTTIVWMIGQQVFFIKNKTGAAINPALGWLAGLGGGLFMLGFFTVHFGGFHFGHSVFLNAFFPVEGKPAHGPGLPSLSMYGTVFARYWWFLPIAFLAERQVFRFSASKDVNMMEPYKNVIRMHLLIFFFAFTAYAGLESFFVYAVVYAVYFFPWRVFSWKKKMAVA